MGCRILSASVADLREIPSSSLSPPILGKGDKKSQRGAKLAGQAKQLPHLATRVKLKTQKYISGTSVHRIFINVSATVLKLPGAGGAACKNSLTQDFPSL